MATGDLKDIAARIRAVLPASWFPSVAEKNTPVLDGVLAGLAWPWTAMYGLLTYIRNQSRLQTGTGNFVDMAATDYFGGSLPRVSGESDADYIARIQKEFVVKRNTRAAFEEQIDSLTTQGRIFEPWRAPDCACYGRDAFNADTRRYGSRSSPGCVFVEVDDASADKSALATALLKTKSEGIDVFIAIKS
ncbi:hypothetical protein AA0472_0267 [Acetobacter estunensis NRIC 0472]|uniref:Uncharacterized protein n=1 Tax=Acetobacter estunensis TaxID=104097 RepID=A0A967B8H1_9PROT|nr:hypothetical protein [Acetobacter estunensis]NHO54101.1 hypothetical protein [Acetobacter estunensis]GBQ20856.1 hypothetical protein AA0472_0267 [Acetobacter estunensis NRIC 0472]